MAFLKISSLTVLVVATVGTASALLQPLPATASTIEPGINPELKAHSALFAKKIYKVADNVYSAVGWGLANSIMVVGENGIIIVDTGEDIESAREVYSEFRKITDKPVKAIIYTHFHPDHINGVKAYTSEEQVQSGEVAVIAHSTLLGNVINQGSRIGPILGMRTGYTAGVFLSAEEKKHANLGIGPMPNVGQATFIAPSLTYESRKTMTIAGVELELRHVPSEAPDETAVYLPENNVLLSGETTQGPTLPNIHTLRGTKFRDPVQWYKSIDVLRSYNAEHLVPSHGQPVSGKNEVEDVLRVTRDGIQYIHDQTVRHMNRGLTEEELANTVVLPPHLANQKPYLREYYGTVRHTVRQIYQGYLGWFSGDPVDLQPTPPIERADRYINLMGGRDAVFEQATLAYEQGDYQWAAELATLVIRVDNDDTDARNLKADCFRMQGYAHINANWRNWYLTSAMELDGSLDVAIAQQRLRAALASPDLLAALPASAIVEGLSTKLNAELTADVELLVMFEITNSGEVFGLEIRRGIAQFHSSDREGADARLTLGISELHQLIAGSISVDQAVQNGAIKVAGDAAALSRFFDYFENPPPINLTVR